MLFILSVNFVMPPTLKKLKEHIALGLSVRPSIHYKFKIRVLKFHRWIPHQKITEPYFFNLDYLPLWIYSPFKGSYLNFVIKIFQKL